MSRKVYLIGWGYDGPSMAFLDEALRDAKFIDLTAPRICTRCNGSGITGYYEKDQVLICTTALGESPPTVKAGDPISCMCGGKPIIPDYWKDEMEITDE